MVGNWNDIPPRPGKVQPTPHLECSDTEPGPARPFLKIGVARSWLFGAIRYRAIGSVAKLHIFGLQAYARVGYVKWVAGLVFGRDKAGK
jgi:hypothetical protein